MNLLEAIDDPHLFRPGSRTGRRGVPGSHSLPPFLRTSSMRTRRPSTATAPAALRRPQEPFREAWLVIGRRGGKSFVLALLAVFLAAFKDYASYLAPGERATVLVIAADRKQARTIMRYAHALLTGVPMLARMIERETADAFDLTNSTTIEVATASFRSVRGYTLAAGICDELAFWRSEDAANPDYEVLAALRPAMATIPGSLLLCASSPYARRGALWETYSRHFGKTGPVLVWKAPTRTMNPTVPASFIEAEYEKDPACGWR